ncbi:MAG TPA: hypothetical protein VLW50_10615 [Streptosporangiaceae bacterium]|nr:hypothetical protein [Streptosporangiaceae bacterium]
MGAVFLLLGVFWVGRETDHGLGALWEHWWCPIPLVLILLGFAAVLAPGDHSATFSNCLKEQSSGDCHRRSFSTSTWHFASPRRPQVNGARVKRVRLALGHSTPMVTLNTYVGEWPDTGEQTRTIIDPALGDVPRVRPSPGFRRNCGSPASETVTRRRRR